MTFSNPIDQIAVALAKAQAELQPIQKTIDGYNYKYADLYDVMEVILPVTSKYGLSVTSIVDINENITVILLHISGQYILSTAPLKPKSDEHKDFGTSMTYKRRYLTLGLLGIHPRGDDDDGGNNKKQDEDNNRSNNKKQYQQNQTSSNYNAKKQNNQQQLNISKDKIDLLNSKLMGFPEDIRLEVLKELKVNNFSELKNQDYANALNIIIKTINTYDGE